MSRAKWPSGLRRKMSTMPVIPMKATGADATGEVDNGDAGGEGDASVSLLNS